MVRKVLITAALALAPVAGAAEEERLDEGLSLLQRGTELVIEGLLAEIGPELRGLLDEVEGFAGYHPPEVLPNGDILIRRRTPGTPEPDPETGEVDL